MVLTIKWKSNGVGEQSVSHTVKTVRDLRGLARKLDTVVRETVRWIPSAADASVLSVSIVKG